MLVLGYPARQRIPATRACDHYRIRDEKVAVRSMVGQVGEVTLLFISLHRPGDACLLPGGVRVRPVERGFGAAHTVLAGL